MAADYTGTFATLRRGPGTDGAERVTVTDRRHLEVYHNSYHNSQISTLRMALSVRF